MSATVDLLMGGEPLARPKGRAKRPRTPEALIQRAIRDRLRFLGIRSAHVPNAGKRSPMTGRVMKADGLVPGFPDLIVWTRDGRVGFLEVKAEDGRLSDAQERQIADMRGDRLNVAVVNSQDAAVAALRGWGWLC